MREIIKKALNLFLFMWQFSLDLLWKCIRPIAKPIWEILEPSVTPIINPIIQKITHFSRWANRLANETNTNLSSKMRSLKPKDLTPEAIQQSVTHSVTWLWKRAKETSPFQTNVHTTEEKIRSSQATPPRLG